MLDVAWPELVVIGAVALVAIGPKDLPKVMRVMGQWAGKARNAVHELQRGFEQLSYESEIADKLKDEVGVSPPMSPPSPKSENDHERSES